MALKVFLHGSYDQVRKIRWKFGGCDDDFQELGRSLGQCFGVGDEVLVLGYDDEEGDRVTIGGNQELMDWRKETKVGSYYSFRLQKNLPSNCQFVCKKLPSCS